MAIPNHLAAKIGGCIKSGHWKRETIVATINHMYKEVQKYPSIKSRVDLLLRYNIGEPNFFDNIMDSKSEDNRRTINQLNLIDMVLARNKETIYQE